MSATYTLLEVRAILERLSPEARATLSTTARALLEDAREPTSPVATRRSLLGVIPVVRGRINERGKTRHWLEKDEQRECWRVLLACGFQVKWLSQAWASGQTKGIPDLFARHHGKGLLLWVECKNPMDPAPWTPAQRAFSDERLPCEDYVLGSEGNLRAYLRTHGFDMEPHIRDSRSLATLTEKRKNGLSRHPPEHDR
jgi:hypothetical protein